MMSGDIKHCAACSSTLTPPYIQCMECPQYKHICLHCFAHGTEFQQHHSDHKYTVIKYDFSLFGSGWKGSEEVRLLEAMSECGMGNWSDVAHMMQHQSRSSCEQHYNRYYLEKPVSPLPQLPDVDRVIFPSVITFRPCDDPPRPVDGSSLQVEMAGYMPARGDFTIEHDNYAEMNLRDISFTPPTYDQLYHLLKLKVVEIYGNVLKDRLYRKRIIKNCGLINIKSIIVMNRAYEQTIGHDKLEALRVFNRLMKQQDWDMYLESYHYEIQLRHAIHKLREYRRSGITTFRSAQLYDYLKERRVRQKSLLHSLSDVLPHLDDRWSCSQWLRKQAMLCQSGEDIPSRISSLVIRRPALPLDIISLPGYDKLSPDEQELCSTVRLVPESFLEFKNILISECQKLGFLRLAHARTLIKIDVNKTRKMYDFLVSQGHINKETST